MCRQKWTALHQRYSAAVIGSIQSFHLLPDSMNLFDTMTSKLTKNYKRRKRGGLATKPPSALGAFESIGPSQATCMSFAGKYPTLLQMPSRLDVPKVIRTCF